MSTDHRKTLSGIKRIDQLVAYLRDELDWPIGRDDFEEIDDYFFDFTPQELGIDAKNAAKIDEIKRLRPLSSSQPWGIFFVKFEPKRLPVVALRRILGQVTLKNKASSNRSEYSAWRPDDLLFISNYGEGQERKIALAHFAAAEDSKDLPVLKVLSWDEQDTALHLVEVARTLQQKLSWPADDRNAEQWRRTWRSAFSLGHREVIQTAQELSLKLAELARNIRQQIKDGLAIEAANGPLTCLMKAFKESLVHDLDEDQFADTYAQTIAYGLLSARMVDPSKKTADDLVANLHTSPFLRELMETFLRLGGRKGKAGQPGLDFDELGVRDVIELLDRSNLEAVMKDFGDRNRQEDPVMHFFEGFLQAYDKKIRKDRGVFYTPQPVVSYIVRSVHELLQTEFGLTDGLADTTTWGEMLKKHPGLKLPPLTDEPGEKRTISPDEPFVQILDPATGTATFLVEVIDVIHRTLAAKWKQQRLTDAQQRAAWNDYVPQHLLPRLHAFELMMAPYAIAHMKIGLKLAETGYRFGTEERARIYLTNALEPWVKQLPLIGFDALAHEAAAVNEIKRHKRFTVVIGNPPYSNYGMLNKNPFILGLLEDYKRGLDEKKLNLDDDFIKFVRFSQYMLGGTGVGIFGMITNNVFLDGLTHRQMRESLSRVFPTTYFLNLHGDTRKKEEVPAGGEDKNVFDIQQGVSVALLSKSPKHSEGSRFHADLWGNRDSKYTALERGDVTKTKWRAFNPTSPYFFFVPKAFADEAEYLCGVGAKEIFVSVGKGAKTERDRVTIHFTEDGIRQAVTDFQREATATLKQKYFLDEDSRDWKVASAKADVLANDNEGCFRRILYRPFDTRHTWYSGQTRGFIGTPGYPVLRHMLTDNFALILTRQVTGLPYNHCFAARTLVEIKCASHDRCCDVIPLRLHDSDTLSLGAGGSPNLKPSFLKSLAVKLQLSQKGAHGLPTGLTPEDIFHYAYAVFHSPGYRSRYAEFLKIDFPRLPLTGNLELFRALARLGGELTALHLLESPKLDIPTTQFIGHSREVVKVGWMDDTVWINAGGKKAATTAGTCGFQGVPEAVWNFHIGGYQVCEKWLKDRKGRTLTDEDIAHYHKIVIALTETIRLMTEIDEVIATHGGWPGAFAGASKCNSNKRP